MGSATIISPAQYKRITFSITAERVTEENIDAVAMWCGGIVMKDPARDPKPYIKVPSKRVVLAVLTQAYPGDYVIRHENGQFRVFKEHAFRRTFELASEVVSGPCAEDPCVEGAPVKLVEVTEELKG